MLEYAHVIVHHAGLGQMSTLSKLQHLRLHFTFRRGTHIGLEAALSTMTGIAIRVVPAPMVWLITEVARWLACQPFAA